MAKKAGSREGQQPLLVLIRTVQQAVRVELDAALSEVGVSLPQLAVLASITRLPGVSNAELARAAFVSPQSMGELISGLKERELVEQAPHPDNARILRTTLTAEGARILSRGGAEAAKVEARLTQALSSTEQQVMRRALERCIAAMTSSQRA